MKKYMLAIVIFAITVGTTYAYYHISTVLGCTAIFDKWKLNGQEIYFRTDEARDFYISESSGTLTIDNFENVYPSSAVLTIANQMIVEAAYCTYASFSNELINRLDAGLPVYNGNIYALDWSKWDIYKGTPICSSGIVRMCSIPDYGCEIQTKDTMAKWVELKVIAKSDLWAPDTSVGLERWVWTPESLTHYGIVVTTGYLGIINHSIPGDISEKEHYLPIPNWDSIVHDWITIKIKWFSGKVELWINNELSVTYTGNKVPDVPLGIRFNASNYIADCLQVDYMDCKIIDNFNE